MCSIPVPKQAPDEQPFAADFRALCTGRPEGFTQYEAYRAGREHSVSVANAVVVDAVNQPLLRELQFAHQIIRNALGLMTLEQKSDWARVNDRDGLVEAGTTRANEREAVITRVRGPR